MRYIEIMKNLRIDNDLSQKTISAILGIDQKQYSRYETGKNEMPIRYLVELCKYYKVSADYILGLPKNLNWPRG